MRSHTWKFGERQMAVQSTARIESEKNEPIVRMTRDSATQVRVLCATDLSPRSQRAVARAMRLGRQLDAQLIMLHVIDPAEYASDSMHARDEIARQLSAVGVDTRREPEIRVRTGNYVEGIAAVAREADTDIIILGAQGRRSLAPLVGTSAERITALAGRPALIVNQESHRRYDAVVIAAELSDAFVQVVRVASSLMLLDAERVSIVHRLELPRGPLFAFDALAAGRNLEAWEKAAKARVLRHLDAAGVESSRARIIFQQAPPIRAMRRVIRSVKAGLVIVGAKDRSIFSRAMWGNLANDALRKLECDILVAAPKVESVAGTVKQDMASQRIDLRPRELRLS